MYLKISKILFVLLLISIGALILLNPTEKQFNSYAKAHAQAPDYIDVRTAREINYGLLSIYYTRGYTLEGYYLGIAGAFYYYRGTSIPNIDYLTPEELRQYNYRISGK